MINTLNSGEDSLQLNCSIIEVDLFKIYININFLPFDININTSELGSVSETIKIFKLR